MTSVGDDSKNKREEETEIKTHSTYQLTLLLIRIVLVYVTNHFMFVWSRIMFLECSTHHANSLK
jgi:hypothetical protein